MIVRALDANGDWTFGQGKSNYKRGRDAIKQNIQTRLLSFLGNCFFALQEGIDWFNRLGSKNQIQLQLDISTTILNTAGVLSIRSLDFSLNENRQFSLSYEVSTTYGIVYSDLVLPESSLLITEDGDPITTEDGDNIIV